MATGAWWSLTRTESLRFGEAQQRKQVSDHVLLDTPVAICSFISEATQPRVPALAVAAGAHIYIYRNLRPYFKFVIPSEDVNTEEQDIWQRVMASEMTVGDAVAELTRLQDAGVLLTTRSLQLMNIGDPDAKMSFAEHWQGQPLVATTVITCMDTIKQSIDEPDAVSCLVAGTESGRLLILNAAGTAIAKNVWIGAAPALLAVQGELDAGYRIYIAGRDGKLYCVRNGELTQLIIQLESQPVGLVRMPRGCVAVGCMNDVVHVYNGSTGAKAWSIYLPAPIVCMSRLEVSGQRMTRGLLVALATGEVRAYHDKALVSLHTSPSPVVGMWFSRYGREDNALVSITRSGGLDIKILPRTANLETPAVPPGPPPEQDIPLAVPKKTRLYVEQTQREREQAIDMHRTFQRDLAQLRLSAARAYVKLLTDGQGAAAFTTSASLGLTLAVQGLGPRFKLAVQVRNDGAAQLLNLPVVLLADTSLYRVTPSSTVLPLLVPGLQYKLEVDVLCLNPAAPPDTISVLLLPPLTAPSAASNGAGSAPNSAPLLQAQVRMPMSELEEDD